jgi:hypothetical protein
MDVQTVEHCCAIAGCGVVFWVTATYDNRCREDHRMFRCPNGHGLLYPKPAPPPAPKKRERKK